MRFPRFHVLALTPGVLVLLAARTGPAAAQVFSSSSSSGPGVDCTKLELMAAKGVPQGDVHQYRFQGVCRLLRFGSSTSKVAGISTGTDHSSTQVGTVWALTEIRWDRATGVMNQAMKVEGDRNGRLELILKCAQDPVLAKVLCHKVSYDNGTGWSGFDIAWNQGRPITNGLVTEAEAAALSKQAGASAPPPPPPPPAPEKSAPTARTDPATEQTVAVAKPALDPIVRRGLNPQPEPPSALPHPGFAEIPLEPDARRVLENGRSLASRREAGELRWAILSGKGEVLRLFPAGSRAFESPRGEIMVDWGGGTYRAGHVRPTRLRLPGSR